MVFGVVRYHLDPLIAAIPCATSRSTVPYVGVHRLSLENVLLVLGGPFLGGVIVGVGELCTLQTVVLGLVGLHRICIGVLVGFFFPPCFFFFLLNQLSSFLSVGTEWFQFAFVSAS